MSKWDWVIMAVMMVVGWALIALIYAGAVVLLSSVR